MGIVPLLATCGGSGDSVAGPPPPVQAEEEGPCSPLSQRAGHTLIYCPAVGGTCASPAACELVESLP